MPVITFRSRVFQMERSADRSGITFSTLLDQFKTQLTISHGKGLLHQFKTQLTISHGKSLLHQIKTHVNKSRAKGLLHQFKVAALGMTKSVITVTKGGQESSCCLLCAPTDTTMLPLPHHTPTPLKTQTHTHTHTHTHTQKKKKN